MVRLEMFLLQLNFTCCYGEHSCIYFLFLTITRVASWTVSINTLIWWELRAHFHCWQVLPNSKEHISTIVGMATVLPDSKSTFPGLQALLPDNKEHIFRDGRVHSDSVTGLSVDVIATWSHLAFEVVSTRRHDCSYLSFWRALLVSFEGSSKIKTHYQGYVRKNWVNKS